MEAVVTDRISLSRTRPRNCPGGAAEEELEARGWYRPDTSRRRIRMVCPSRDSRSHIASADPPMSRMSCRFALHRGVSPHYPPQGETCRVTDAVLKVNTIEHVLAGRCGGQPMPKLRQDRTVACSHSRVEREQRWDKPWCGPRQSHMRPAAARPLLRHQ